MVSGVCLLVRGVWRGCFTYDPSRGLGPQTVALKALGNIPIGKELTVAYGPETVIGRPKAKAKGLGRRKRARPREASRDEE